MTDSLNKKITQLCSLPAVSEALSLLRTKLPSHLHYHAYSHTEDVLGEVVKLALLDSLAERDVELLAVAAAWHDVGFIYSNSSNEPLAARQMRDTVGPLALYSDAELTTIEQMILDTALIPDGETFKQHASNPLSRYLLDADLANFGRDDFFEKSELQRLESNELEQTFRHKTLSLVRNHRWLTKAAHTLWQVKKEQNLQALESSLRPC